LSKIDKHFILDGQIVAIPLKSIALQIIWPNSGQSDSNEIACPRPCARAKIDTLAFSKNLRSRRSGTVEDFSWRALSMRSLARIGLALLFFFQWSVGGFAQSGIISTVAGNGTRGDSGDGGAATSDNSIIPLR
jgi:hypothetical protein